MGTDTPVTVSIIGTESTQGGGVAPIPSGTLAVTPDHQPNLLINVISPVIAVLVRAISSFLTTFLSLLTAAGVGSSLFAAKDLHGVIISAAWAAAIVAGVATIKNAVTVFGRLEGKFPLMTGTI